MKKLGNSKELKFQIKVNEEEECERRLRDFITLRNSLAKVFPGCYIPKIPKI
jgi:hypothetical protein